MTNLVKGSVITATVEEALDNCIMVYVIHGSTTFRGVLLDEKNPLISRTPTREGFEKTRETPDFTAQERTSMVVLQTSPRRTANSKKSGLSHRLVLLNQQEGKSSEITTVNMLPTEDSDLSKKPKASQKRKQAGKKPLKTAKRCASKPKTKTATQTTAKVKRKIQNQEGYTRPFKKTKGMQEVYSQGEKLSSENKTRVGYMKGVTNIVLQPCLVKVCPLTTSPGILNQSGTNTAREQTISAPRSFLNSIIEERIARQLKGEGRNTNTQTVAKIPGLSVDLERLASSNTHFDGVYDTVSDNDTTSEVVDILDEETDSATSVIDNDVTSQTVDVSSEKTDTMSHHDNTTAETVDILGEETDSAASVIDNDVTSQTVDVSSEKTDTMSHDNKTAETVDILGEETDSAASVIDNDVTSQTVDVSSEKTDTMSHDNTTAETVDILGEETDSAASVIDNDITSQTVDVSSVKTDTMSHHDNTTAETVDILGEETDSATSFIDNDVTSQTVDISSEKIDVVEVTDVTMTIMNHDEEFETVDILRGQIDADTSFLGNELKRSESVFSGKAVVDRAEIPANNVGEITCPVTSATAHAQHDELSIYQNTPQSSENDMPQKLYDRNTSISTDPEDLQTPVRQTAIVNTWEADIDVGENGAAVMELPKHNMQQIGGDDHDAGLASSEPFKFVPQGSSDSEQHSNCSEISSTRLSIVVKLQPLNMKTGEANAAQKPTTWSDAGRKSPRLSVEDIVWGKVHGHPWWPGKVLSLSGTIDEVGRMSAKDASVAWFGSNTSSAVPVTRLSPFVTKFHKRHSPGIQGHYRIAVNEAMQAFNTTKD